jgi:hypothetical protein
VNIITKVAAAIQQLFGVIAETVAKDHPVILRRRKFTTASLAQTFVFGFLDQPDADDEKLARTAALFGPPVTPQAVEQRVTDRTARFLEALFGAACRHLVAAQSALAPVLVRFTAVHLLDSSTIALPDALRDRFPGCGGRHGGGQAAMKLQVRWDLRSGALGAIAVEPGRDCDYKTPLQTDRLVPGSLRITDLGYFDTAVFEELDRHECFWLSRLQFGTSVFTADGRPLAPLAWLSEQPGPFVDQPIRVGTERKLACRIVAWRVPEEVANRRRQKLIAAAKRKDGRVPGAERLAWCDWTILITNVPVASLAPAEVAILYRARWQIELLFKRWKSLGLIAELSGATVARRLVRLWSRLLAVLVQHWLLLTTTWGDYRTSLAKVCEAIRDHALLLAVAIHDPIRLEAAMERLRLVLSATAKQNKRKRPSTFELLNDASRLEYSLT